MAKDFIFVSSNEKKIKMLETYLELPLKYQPVETPEIQALDLVKVGKAKALAAYNILNQPVLVEDVSLEFLAWGKLPGTFIKFFLEELSLEQICNLLNTNRSAVAKTIFVYYDGQLYKTFESYLRGHIVKKPLGDGGFGFDPIFKAEGCSSTIANLNQTDYRQVYMLLKPIKQLATFLKT